MRRGARRGRRWRIFPSLRVFTLPETPGIDFLDALLAGNVPKIRFGRVLHTFLADKDG